MSNYKYMKNIIAILLISTACSAQSLDVLSLHQDKQLHVSYTYIISSATTSYVLKKTGNKKKAILIGIGVAMSVGETHHLKHSRIHKD